MEVNNSLPVGTILKGLSYSYRIEKTLGQGSFGITYLASVKMIGALGAIDANIKVAIKEFFMRDINGRSDTTVTSGSKGGIYDDYKRKFTREAVNLSKLQHPNIIKVIESFEANNTVYYVMEYIGGGSLDDYITKNNGLKEDEAIGIVKQIGSALSFMHKNKMLHLDLKPSNIMRKESGDVVLIDFGLSKQYDSKGEPESSTKVGAGTPGYAPLEQANYREGKGFPVTMDVYALGATMFKMLTGVRAPEASDILNDGFPLYELQEHSVDERISASIAKAMAPTKKNRCKSVAEFINSLDNGERTVTDIVVTDNKGIRNKSNSTDFLIQPNTSYVRIEYQPEDLITGRYIAYINSNNVDLCRFDEATHIRYAIDKIRYDKFLSDLQDLKSFFKEEENYKSYGLCEELVISLFDYQGKFYAKYWIGGNEFGNLRVDIQFLKNKINNITPYLAEYLKPIEKDDESGQGTESSVFKELLPKIESVQYSPSRKGFVLKFLFSLLTCSLCTLGVMCYFHSMPDEISEQIYVWEDNFFSPYFTVQYYDYVIIVIYVVLCMMTHLLMESSIKLKLSSISGTLFIALMFPVVVGISWLVPGFGEWIIGLFSDIPRGTFFYIIQFFISICISMFIVNVGNIRDFFNPIRFLEGSKFDIK